MLLVVDAWMPQAAQKYWARHVHMYLASRTHATTSLAPFQRLIGLTLSFEPHGSAVDMMQIWGWTLEIFKVEVDQLIIHI